MKKNFIYTIVLIALVFSSGCEDLNNPGEIKIKNSLFFNLQVNSSHQHVYIYRNPDISGRTEYDAADPYVNFFNRDAEVTLKDLINGKDIYFKFVTDTMKSSYLPNPIKSSFTNSGTFEAKPLTDYYLSVKADGNVIIGKVTTPGDFDITSPRKGEIIRGHLNLEKLVFRWSSSKNAKGYIVRVYLKDKYYDNPVEFFYMSDWAGYKTTDTVVAFKPPVFYSQSVASGECIIRIIAHDDNYFQHYYNKKEIVGLNGAYGCFSSSVTKEVRFRYISD